MAVQLKRNDTQDIIAYEMKDRDGKAVNLTGATVRFVMGNDTDLIVNASATITDAANGKVQYTLLDTDTLVSGLFLAEFEVTFSDGHIKSFPENGYINVNILNNIQKDKSTYVEDAIAIRVSEIDTLKQEMAAKIAIIDDMQNQLNTMTVEGDSSVEAAQARVQADGTAYASLRDRLNASDVIVKSNQSYIAGFNTSAQLYRLTDPDGFRTQLSAPVNLTTVATGFYYTTGAAITTPAPPVGGDASWYLLDVFKTPNGMKQFILRRSYDNREFTGTIHTDGVFSGWKEALRVQDSQTVLWTGAAYMNASQTITPSKKLADCKNGWMLVWSDYDPGKGPNDYDINYCVIPKWAGTNFNGKKTFFTIGTYTSATSQAMIVKSLFVYNEKLTGDDANGQSKTGTQDCCLRYVLEY